MSTIQTWLKLTFYDLLNSHIYVVDPSSSIEFIEYFEQISVIYQSGITSQGERSSNRTEGDWLW